MFRKQSAPAERLANLRAARGTLQALNGRQYTLNLRQRPLQRVNELRGYRALRVDLSRRTRTWLESAKIIRFLA